MKIIKVILACCMACTIADAVGQTLDYPENIPSPNAMSLGMYGEIPVSLFTGVPDISIPIYEVKYKSLTLPISLNYHGSGVRPDVHPGWVGLNWSLNAGGMASCVQHGSNDWTDENALLGITGLSDFCKHGQGLDEYSYNFVGHTGSFYASIFGSNSGVTPLENRFRNVSGERLKLERITRFSYCCTSALKQNDEYIDALYEPIPGGPSVAVYPKQTFSDGFQITDENGVKYLFGNQYYDEAIDYVGPLRTKNWFDARDISSLILCSSFGSDRFRYNAQTLYLKKIISADNCDTISLNYERGPYICNFNLKNDTLQGSLVSPVYLKSIETPLETITFTTSASNELNYSNDFYTNPDRWEKIGVYSDNMVYSPTGGTIDPSDKDPNAIYYERLSGNDPLIPYYNNNTINGQTLSEAYQLRKYFKERIIWLKLDKITITSKINSFTKEFDFSYNNDPTKRLMLSSVQEKTGTETKPPYTFEYDDSYALPGYLSGHVDHWGFYNGPNSETDYTKTNYRAPNTTYALAGSLKKINYPTGGYSKFYFEPHAYSAEVNIADYGTTLAVSGEAGGLRVRRIEESADGTTISSAKDYYYLKGYNGSTISLPSSGILTQVPSYIEGTYYRSESVIPMTASSMKTHVEYSEVAEVVQGNGYTVHQFTDYIDHADDGSGKARNSRALERGKPLKTTFYNSANIKLKEIEYNYTAVNQPDGCSFLYDYYADYNDLIGTLKYTHTYLPSKIKTTEYNGSNKLIRYQELTYSPNTLLPYKTKTYDEDVYGINADYNYVESIDLRSGDLYSEYLTTSQTNPQNTKEAIFKYMQDNNFLSYPVISFKIKNGIITEGSFTEYGMFWNEIDNCFGRVYNPDIKDWENNLYDYAFYMVKPIKDYRLSASTAKLVSQYYIYLEGLIIGSAQFPQLFTSRYDNSLVNQFTPTMFYDKFDYGGNLVEYHKNNYAPNSILYSYQYSVPVALIENSGISTVNVKLGATDGNIATVHALTYNATSSLWEGKVSPNKIFTENAITFQRSSPLNDATFRSTLSTLKQIPNANVKYFTYKLPVGVSSITDINGSTQYFDYDAFGRLITVKDKDGNLLKEYKYNYKH